LRTRQGGERKKYENREKILLPWEEKGRSSEQSLFTEEKGRNGRKGESRRGMSRASGGTNETKKNDYGGGRSKSGVALPFLLANEERKQREK